MGNLVLLSKVNTDKIKHGPNTYLALAWTVALDTDKNALVLGAWAETDGCWSAYGASTYIQDLQGKETLATI